MQRLSSWSIVILALAVFAAAAFVITKNDPVPNAGKILSLPSTATTASPTSATGTGGSTASSGVIAFLGDDWTAGQGASSKAARFSTLVAKRLGLREKNFGVDGTGYARTSASGGAYQTRVADVAASHPQVVVVSGGRNDTVDDIGTVRAAIDKLFTSLHRQLPDATLVAVEPMWGDSDKPAELAPVTAAVKTSVTKVGGDYVAVDDPIHDHPSYMADDADPNDKGYAAIAAALTPRLTSLVSGR